MCRLMINTYKIPGAVKLFRYDIECPPDNWNTDFKNKEYVYSDDCEDLRIKNRMEHSIFSRIKRQPIAQVALLPKIMVVIKFG